MFYKLYQIAKQQKLKKTVLEQLIKIYLCTFSQRQIVLLLSQLPRISELSATLITLCFVNCHWYNTRGWRSWRPNPCLHTLLTITPSDCFVLPVPEPLAFMDLEMLFSRGRIFSTVYRKIPIKTWAMVTTWSLQDPVQPAGRTRNHHLGSLGGGWAAITQWVRGKELLGYILLLPFPVLTVNR